MTHMRPDLLPGLLRAAARNQARGFGDMALFEVGPTFTGGEPGEQSLLASGLLIGSVAPRDPFGSRRAVDVFDAKADAEAVLAAMGAPARVQILRGAAGWWHPGRHGMICLGPKKVLGVFGELHPRIEELSRELAVSPSAEAYLRRGELHRLDGNFPAALADMISGQIAGSRSWLQQSPGILMVCVRRS
jgi:phenylalanyl-tRNA synthetase beta subunit